MDCRDCRYADWKRTAAGRLHPSGDGECTVPIKMPTLPKAFYWHSFCEPRPAGGFINRHKWDNYAGCQRFQPIK